MNRDEFDAMSQLCTLYTGRPWDGTLAHLTAAINRQSEATDVMEAHADWLTQMRTRAIESGHAWTTTELRRQSRLAGDLTTPPEWLTR